MLIAVSIGLLASLLMGALFVPTGGRFSPTSGGMRALSLYCVLSGLAWWLSLFSVACLLSQRLYFAITLVVVLHGVLIAVNYTKFTALKEPFILQDERLFQCCELGVVNRNQHPMQHDNQGNGKIKPLTEQAGH